VIEKEKKKVKERRSRVRKGEERQEIRVTEVKAMQQLCRVYRWI
jgi:hypothetical protein